MLRTVLHGYLSNITYEAGLVLLIPFHHPGMCSVRETMEQISQIRITLTAFLQFLSFSNRADQVLTVHQSSFLYLTIAHLPLWGAHKTPGIPR